MCTVSKMLVNSSSFYSILHNLFHYILLHARKKQPLLYKFIKHFLCFFLYNFTRYCRLTNLLLGSLYCCQHDWPMLACRSVKYRNQITASESITRQRRTCLTGGRLGPGRLESRYINQMAKFNVAENLLWVTCHDT